MRKWLVDLLSIETNECLLFSLPLCWEHRLRTEKRRRTEVKNTYPRGRMSRGYHLAITAEEIVSAIAKATGLALSHFRSRLPGVRRLSPRVAQDTQVCHCTRYFCVLRAIVSAIPHDWCRRSLQFGIKGVHSEQIQSSSCQGCNPYFRFDVEHSLLTTGRPYH